MGTRRHLRGWSAVWAPAEASRPIGQAPNSLREVRDLLVWCASDEAPWTACTRAYLRGRAPKLLLAASVVIAGDPLRRIHDLIESQRGALALLE